MQAEDGIRYLVRSRGLGDVYKRQMQDGRMKKPKNVGSFITIGEPDVRLVDAKAPANAPKAKDKSERWVCLLYTSDAADERSSVDLGGRRIINKKTNTHTNTHTHTARSTVYIVHHLGTVLRHIHTKHQTHM